MRVKRIGRARREEKRREIFCNFHLYHEISFSGWKRAHVVYGYPNYQLDDFLIKPKTHLKPNDAKQSASQSVSC